MSVTSSDLKKIFAGLVPDDVMSRMDPALPLTSQGVDSLALTALAVALQSAFKVTITPEEGIKLKTLNDVAAYLNKMGAKA